MPDHLPPAPKPTAADYAAALVKAGISAIPDWGSPAAELFGMITAPILGRRRDEWFEEIRLRLNELSMEEDGLTIESLMQNEEFVSALAQASQAALRTHQSEKRAALRNAVLNIALAKAPSEDKQLLFLNLVDRFGPLHLRLLAFSEDTEKYSGKWVRQGPGTIPVHHLISIALPDIAGEFQLVSAVVSELGSLGLIGVSNAAGPIPTFSKWITNLGEEFLCFIREPEVGTAPKETA